jgi:methionyl-tRNA synthetase
MSGPEFALAFMVFGGGFWVLRPLAGAIAKRIGGDVPSRRDDEKDEAILTELQQLRAEMTELAERLDFAERLLAQQREASRLGPGGP